MDVNLDRRDGRTHRATGAAGGHLAIPEKPGAVSLWIVFWLR
jgi:hypothetical protein